LRLSIVIAAWNGSASLERCLRSLNDEVRAVDTEVIVAANFKPERLAGEFSLVHWIKMPAGTTVPALRTAGILRSTGEIVGLAEDHCTFGEHWCMELKKAHESAHAVIGGVVENASTQRALDWAVYFLDYGKFMPPMRAGVVGALSGVNVSYKRPALMEVESSFRGGFHEAITHAEIVKRGGALYLAPAMVVYHHKNYKTTPAMALAYHLGRSYAGKRVSGASALRRGLFVLGSPLLTVLLPGRVIAGILRKRRHIAALARALPHLLALTSSWAWGEFRGYLSGEGRSAAQWK
jgi:glycosyltransferase involved in cell wall biosynthesis